MITQTQTFDPEILLEKGVINKLPKEYHKFMKNFIETQMFQTFLQDYIDNDESLKLFSYGLQKYIKYYI